eukprot:c52489_g1_i1.p1 GENE.c52489_g1_i1~~c52489_g1_i1.p1  ORF type:complete len:322 (+),score=30.15 c52489_g1_i1:72-1037(+)
MIQMGFVMSRGNTRLMFSTSLLSVLGTSLVIATLCREPKRQTSIVLLNLFASQLLTSLGSLAGEPEDTSFACWFQGIVTNVFTLSSLMWAVIVTFLLLRSATHVLRTVQRLRIFWVGVICYGIPVLVTLLPLINSTYGAPPPDQIGWCWVVATDRTPSWGLNFWYWGSYYAWVWLCFAWIFAMLMVITAVYMRMRLANRRSVSTLGSLILSLTGYPIAIVLAWFPAACYDFYTYNKPDVLLPFWVRKFGNACACSMGLMCALTYFSHPIHRLRLRQIFSKRTPELPSHKTMSFRFSNEFVFPEQSSKKLFVQNEAGLLAVI